MITKFKLFEYSLETGQIIDYNVGDIVICISGQPDKWYRGKKVSGLKEGEEYKVIKLYSIPEDKFLNNKFLRVDVQNIKNNEISKGWESTRFKSNIEFMADIYNM